MKYSLLSSWTIISRSSRTVRRRTDQNNRSINRCFYFRNKPITER